MKKIRQRSQPQVRRHRQATGISPPAATASKGLQPSDLGSWELSCLSVTYKAPTHPTKSRGEATPQRRSRHGCTEHQVPVWVYQAHVPIKPHGAEMEPRLPRSGTSPAPWGQSSGEKAKKAGKRQVKTLRESGSDTAHLWNQKRGHGQQAIDPGSLNSFLVNLRFV